MIDRVVVREDQMEGHAIRGWSVQAQLASDDSAKWVVLANGSFVGNKWITLLSNNYTVTALRAMVTASATNSAPKLRSVSGHLCARSDKSTHCKVQQNFAGNGVGGTVAWAGHAAGECCAACKAKKGCAFALLMPAKSGSFPTCTVHTASYAGDKMIQGAVTLSPPSE